jgi:signal peptidase II
MSSPTETISTPKNSQAARLWLLSIAAVVILLDRVTKYWVDRHLNPGSAITIIPRVFRISHVLNTGAAFSFFAESASPERVRNALIIFSILAAVMVFIMLWRVGRTFSITSVALALILGGALGNLYDRLHYHFVIDFLEVHIFSYHWPDFNVADSCIVIGACFLVLEIFRPQPSDQPAE